MALRVRPVLAGLAALGLAGLIMSGIATFRASPTSRASDRAALSIKVRADDPRAPVILLTNEGSRPCQTAATALGTLTFRSVRQASTTVEPTYFDAAFDDSLESAIAARQRVLQPGATIELKVPVHAIGPTGLALETVVLSARGPVGAFYMIEPDKPLRLEVSYSVPVASQGDVPGCVMAGATISSADRQAVRPVERARFGWTLFDWTLFDWTQPGGAGSFAPVLLLTPAGLWMRRRRSRLGGGAGKAFLVFAALMFGDGASHRADAGFAVDPAVANAWAACSAVLHGPGGDPAGILPILEPPGVTVQILPAGAADETHEGAISRTEIFVFWDPNDRHPYFGKGGNADPCTSLYHEFYHASEDARGTQDRSPCVTASGSSGIPVNEVRATRAQNQLRALLGLEPRDHYGRTSLPAGECLPPEQQPPPAPACPSGRCADSNGDPHLSTFDGMRYDFQAAGEFVAVRDPAGGFEVQVRQVPFGDSRQVAVNSAVALDVAGDRVQLTIGQGQPELRVNGEPRALAAMSLPEKGSIGLTQTAVRPGVVVTWPDGSSVTVAPIGPWGLHLIVSAASTRSGRLEGLLGNFDGDATNDIRRRGGPPLTTATFEQLYPAVADSWRVEQNSSLFTYSAGTSTRFFTDRTFPDRAASAADVPNRAALESLCRRAGITERVVLDNCILDVGLTGQPDFALALGVTQQVVLDARVEPVRSAASDAAAVAPGGRLSNSSADAPLITCNRAARDIEGAEGTSWFLRCPVCANPAGGVWGTDFYTDDSSACAAAVHAGAITREGGVVLVTWTRGFSTYAASQRHGLSTADYGAWHRSFFVQAVDAAGRPTSAAPAPPPAGTVRAGCTTRGDMIPNASRVICPVGCASGSLWGTDVYTSDSAVCLAAVHSGLTTPEQGGRVTLSRTGRQQVFLGTTRNGVTSSNYGPWDSTFRVSRGTP